MGANPTIQIVLHPDGRVQCQVNVTGRAIFNMMMETAKQDILKLLTDQEQKAAGGIQIAPAGLAGQLTRQQH
jgi:hypothetical protein